MLNYLERLILFEDKIPNAFLLDTVQALEILYPSTYDQTEDLPRQYQRYFRPHLLRTQAEIAFLTAARRRGVDCQSRTNSSGDAHALAVADPFTITLSRTQGPQRPPRRASFRSTYANYIALGQIPLRGFDLPGSETTVRIDERVKKLYVIICHGPRIGAWRELGFVRANFVAPGGSGFLGSGIDLLARYRSANAEDDIEQVAEPRFGNDAEVQQSEEGTSS